MRMISDFLVKQGSIKTNQEMWKSAPGSAPNAKEDASRMYHYMGFIAMRDRFLKKMASTKKKYLLKTASVKDYLNRHPEIAEELGIKVPKGNFSKKSRKFFFFQ